MVKGYEHQDDSIMSSIEFTRWRSTERDPSIMILCNLGGKQILTFWLVGTAAMNEPPYLNNFKSHQFPSLPAS